MDNILEEFKFDNYFYKNRDRIKYSEKNISQDYHHKLISLYKRIESDKDNPEWLFKVELDHNTKYLTSDFRTSLKSIDFTKYIEINDINEIYNQLKVNNDSLFKNLRYLEDTIYEYLITDDRKTQNYIFID